MAEEREVPDLVTIVDDFKNMSERLDAGIANCGDDIVKQVDFLKSFIQNDLMSILKDFAESSLFGFQDLNDAVNPVEIPGHIAEQATELLQAYKALNQANPALVERLDEVLEHLDDGDDDAEEEA